MQQKKSPMIKPFNLMNLKSPKYDSSHQLNKGFDPNHKFEHYGHGPHSKVKLAKDSEKSASQVNGSDINDKKSSAASEKDDPSASNSEKSRPVRTTEEVEKKKTSVKSITLNKKSAVIKPFSMLSLKSPTYDSSHQLNKSLDPNHKLKNYGHGPHSKVKLVKESENITGADCNEKVKTKPISSEKSNPVKKIPEPINKKSPTIRPFNMMNLKSPAYDSSHQLNKGLDPSHKFEDYAHSSKEKVQLSQAQKPASTRMIRKQITPRSSGGGLPEKFVLSPPSMEAMNSFEGYEEDATGTEKSATLDQPKKIEVPLKRKLPYSLKSLKSPTYDSSTLLNQAFDPTHDINNYAHVQAGKVTVKQQQGSEVQAVRKQVSSRSFVSGSRSPGFDSVSSIDSDTELRSPSPTSPS